MMLLSPKHNAEQLAASFAEIEPRYSEQQALIESSRCLFCFDTPCITACPTGIDIPAFIKAGMVGINVGVPTTMAMCRTEVPGGTRKVALPQLDGVSFYQPLSSIRLRQSANRRECVAVSGYRALGDRDGIG